MSYSPDDEDEDGTRQVERGSMEHSIEELRDVYADDGDEEGEITFAGGITLDVSDAGNYEVVEPEDDGEDGHGYLDEDSFNPDEENREAEDMPGDNADERSEAHDNWDWDAADGE